MTGPIVSARNEEFADGLLGTRIKAAPAGRPVPPSKTHYPDGVTAKKSSSNTVSPAAAALTYEAAVEKLESIVSQIESGEVGLEESMALYEEGILLSQRCKEILATAEQRVETLSKRTKEAKATRPNSGGPLADKDSVRDSDSDNDQDIRQDIPQDLPQDIDDDSGTDGPRSSDILPDEPPF